MYKCGKDIYYNKQTEKLKIQSIFLKIFASLINYLVNS